YGDTIDTYRAVVRDAIAFANGQELGTEGDSFFVVFENASDALRCAVRAQLGLKAADWPSARATRVRMGIHSGEATQRAPDRFVGLAVHQAARVAAAANGGQTLLTESTRALVADALPDGCELDDLGLHRFKDLDRPLRLFEVVHPAFDESRPPRTLDAQIHNLPVQATPFTGRID